MVVPDQQAELRENLVLMRALEGVRVTPWADWSEWRELRDMVANGETERACRRVDLYRLRRRNAVPITMISTVALMQQLKNPDPDPYMQRLALSMTLTRLVNGTTDQLQPRGENSIARSVYSLAVELKLPLILVEIRHQASHNSLPRLSVLECAAKKALAWLEQYYWEPQLKNVKFTIDDDIDAVKKVFEMGNDEERVNDAALMSLRDDGPSVSECNDTEKDESVALLDKLTVLSQKLQDKQSESIPKTAQDEPRPKKPRWELCTDFEAWRRTPLGLVPGQLRVPRISDAGPRKHRPCSRARSRPTADLGSDSSKDEVDEGESSRFPGGGNRPGSPGSQDDDVSALVKKARGYTSEEDAYIAKKRAEFESLAHSTKRIANEDTTGGE